MPEGARADVADAVDARRLALVTPPAGWANDPDGLVVPASTGAGQAAAGDAVGDAVLRQVLPGEGTGAG